MSCVCMCVHVHVCAHIKFYACMGECAYVCVCMCVYMWVSARVRVHVCMCVVCVCVYVCCVCVCECVCVCDHSNFVLSHILLSSIPKVCTKMTNLRQYQQERLHVVQ